MHISFLQLYTGNHLVITHCLTACTEKFLKSKTFKSGNYQKPHLHTYPFLWAKHDCISKNKKIH